MQIKTTKKQIFDRLTWQEQTVVYKDIVKNEMRKRLLLLFYKVI